RADRPRRAPDPGGAGRDRDEEDDRVRRELPPEPRARRLAPAAQAGVRDLLPDGRGRVMGEFVPWSAAEAAKVAALYPALSWPKMTKALPGRSRTAIAN